MTVETGSLVHVTDRQAFMHHAYNAIFNEQVYEYPPNLRARIIAEITQDVCRLVRTMPKNVQQDFLRDVTSQIKDS